MRTITALCLLFFFCFAAAELHYDLVEQGYINMHEFQKFRACDSARRSISVSEWTEALENGDSQQLTTILSESLFSAFYFETAAVTKVSASMQPFEFVLVNAPGLAKKRARYRSFEKPCLGAETSNNQGCVFLNLSGDATLIVPKPLTGQAPETYTHLASFLRNAPREQINAIWMMLASSYKKSWTEKGEQSVWLSTAGNGVPWLHFRLDSSPKYYRYNPYKMQIVSLDEKEFSEL